MIISTEKLIVPIARKNRILKYINNLYKFLLTKVTSATFSCLVQFSRSHFQLISDTLKSFKGYLVDVLGDTKCSNLGTEYVVVNDLSILITKEVSWIPYYPLHSQLQILNLCFI